MVMGAIELTKKCACDSPKWEVIHRRKVKSGKQLGKTMYMLYCKSCKAKWETGAGYAEKMANSKYTQS